MKVVLLSYEYPPDIGGESSYTDGLARSLSKIGVEVVVVTRQAGHQRIASPEGPEIVRLTGCTRRPLRIASFQAALSAYLSRHCRDVQIVHQTNDYFFPLPARRQVDVLTAHHPFGSEVEVVRTVLGKREADRYLRRRSMGYLRRMQRMAIERIPRVVAVSRFTARSLGRECEISPDRLSVCHNGISLERFDRLKERDAARASLNLDPAEQILLHVGRLDYNKDLYTLLMSFTYITEEFPQCRLLIVGSGPQSGWLADSVQGMEERDRITLLGSVGEDTLLDAYAVADVVLLSSLMEGFGIVLAEAMAAGKPCVATACGATNEVVVPGRTGFLVPPRDAKALAEATLRLLTDPRLGRRFGTAARRRVEDSFDWHVIAKCMMSYYEELAWGGLL